MGMLFFIWISGFAEETVMAKNEYRMAWVLTYNENIDSVESIGKVVKEAREANLNALLPIAHRRGRAYYASSFVPVFNPVDAKPPLDTLSEFIKAAHNTSEGKSRIEIHPWIVLFPVWLEQTSPPPGHVILRHPEWSTKKFGEDESASKKKAQKWLDPGVPGVCEYIVDVCKEIVSNYDVDGLNLDYIRYYEGGHGYNPIAIKRFQKRTGRSDTPRPEDKQWQQWQREQITNLVRRIYVETKKIKPHIKISVCTIIWGSPDKPYEQSAFYTRVMQDWPSWFKEGIADINLPMNYRKEDDEQRKADFRTWTGVCRKWCGDGLFVNGLGNYLNSIAGSIEQVKAGRENGAHGSCLFRFGVNNNQEKPYDQLLLALKNQVYKSSVSPPEYPSLDKKGTGFIRGFVFKGDFSQGIDGIQLKIKGTDKTVYTDGSGYFAFVNLKPGETVVEIKIDKDKTKSINVPVVSGQILSLDIDLSEPGK